MGSPVKTTVEISDPLLAEAKALAKREKTTLRCLIEEGLRAILHRKGEATPIPLPDGRFGGEGLAPEFEARGGWSRLREAAYSGFFGEDSAKQREFDPAH